MPDWLVKAVPGVTYLWAPEVYQHDGTYYLYYSASTWGKNNSIIALATNTTLDPADPAYKWVDQGQVVRSTPQSDFNAIDAGHRRGRQRHPVDGLRLVLDRDPDGPAGVAVGQAVGRQDPAQDRQPAGGPERHRGGLRRAARRLVLPVHLLGPVLQRAWTATTRSSSAAPQDVTGPYVDKDGRALLEGGGTVLRKTTGNQVGPGGQSVSEEIIAYHYYDAKAKGAPKLALQRVSWGDDGWPELDADKAERQAARHRAGQEPAWPAARRPR